MLSPCFPKALFPYYFSVTLISFIRKPGPCKSAVKSLPSDAIVVLYTKTDCRSKLQTFFLKKILHCNKLLSVCWKCLRSHYLNKVLVITVKLFFQVIVTLSENYFVIYCHAVCQSFPSNCCHLLQTFCQIIVTYCQTFCQVIVTYFQVSAKILSYNVKLFPSNYCRLLSNFLPIIVVYCQLSQVIVKCCT